MEDKKMIRNFIMFIDAVLIGLFLKVMTDPCTSLTVFGNIIFAALLGYAAFYLSGEIRKFVSAKRKPKRNLR